MQIVDQPITAVVLIDAPPHLELDQESITVTLTEGVSVIDGALQGERGPKGEDGVSADAAFEWATQPFELADTQQEFELNDMPRTGSVSVYLNGLLERFWELTDLTLTLQDAALAGDTVTITYQKEI